MNDSTRDPATQPLAVPPQAPAPFAAQPPASYAGRTHFTVLEYEALLENSSLGIAYTRDRKFFLCNPKFEQMFGWETGALIGQPGELVYRDSDSYAALGEIAIPLLAAGRQLDVEWEMRRKDGSTFLARVIARTINAANTQQGTIWIVEDITAKKRAADEVSRLLREQEAIFETASIGMVFVKDRRIVRSNRRLEETHGYGPGELNGQPTVILHVSDDAYRETGDAYARMARGQTFTTITETRRKDGSTYWARLTGRAVDPAYPQKGSVWLDEDITEQKRAEEQLERLLAEQQALLDNVMVGIVFVRDRKFVRCNPRFEEMFGYGPGEAIGASTRAIYFTEDEFKARGAGETGPGADHGHSREQWLRRKGGSGFWCRLSGRAVEAEGADKGTVWVFEDVSERKRADEEVRRLAESQQQILDNVTVGISFLRNGVVHRCNRRLEEMTGYSAAELFNQSPRLIFADPEEWERDGMRPYLETAPGGLYMSERRYRRKDGSTFLGRAVGRRIDAGAAEQQWIWILDDVTAEREAEERVRRALVEQELTLLNATVGIAFVKGGTYQRCNPRLEEMLGCAPGELLGQSPSLVHAPLRDGEAGDRMLAELAEGKAYSVELQLRRKDGGTFWCKLVGRAIDPSNIDGGSIWIHDDISAERASREALERAVAERTAELEAANARLEAEIAERKQAEARAQHLAGHDALTGLPNRRLLEDRLTQALALSYRNRKQTAVMFVDLDRFKTINDSLGHAVGDALLKDVAGRLVNQQRIGDTICRIGGDEFVIVLPEIKRAADAAHVAQKLIETLSQPLEHGGRSLTVTPSIGISVFPDDGRDAETLIRNADAAMYHAKEMGRANYQFFTDQMNLSASRRLALENDLRRAMQRDELRVYYQPITELKTGCVVAHEALVRWQHPTKGLVSPGEFIQLAEDTGLVINIGEWVLREACRWATFIGIERGLQVTVNLSARQFMDPKLVDLVADALRESGLPPKLLELEITESTAMQHTDVTLSTLKKLSELGISLAIDDFGTGYSSFAYLKRFPVDRLKIDRSFVSDLPHDKDNNAIVAGLVGLAHALGLEVIAEGVETEEQMEFLQECGCDFMQGYLGGRPVDADAASKEYV